MAVGKEYKFEVVVSQPLLEAGSDIVLDKLCGSINILFFGSAGGEGCTIKK